MRAKNPVQVWTLTIVIVVLIIIMALLAVISGSARAQGSGPNLPESPGDSNSIFIPLVVNNFDFSSSALFVNHAGTTFTYSGGDSCATCHASEAQEAYHSNHYQWEGKLGSINDFCGYPDINFIGKLTNLLGQQVDGGCAVCHVGMGKKPDLAGVENVDCLMCHSPEYKRSVMNVGGQLLFVPTPGQVTVREPGRQECLRCHIGAGGGPNNKRGDLEPAHNDPPSAAFDVHMASTSRGGVGLVCIDCHITDDHKIAGQGADLRIEENTAMKRCADCHSSPPHDINDLNQHTAKVACESCHIPAFARIQSTDMYRDFREAEVDPLKNLYEPKLTRQANVTPVYSFWNGGITFYDYASPASTGTLLAAPQGGINDAGSKLSPFKLHHAMQAHDPVTGILLANKAGILFQTGDIDRAIRQAATELGISLPQGYDFVETGRYMGIFHEVAPANDALDCDDCHHPSASRIDFTALGYTPKSTRNGEALCSSCHDPEDENWSAAEYFYRLHEQHVSDENIACAECHNFSR